MEAATYIGLSYQQGLQRQLDVQANNIANASTPGFKARAVMFDQYLNDPVGQERPDYSANDFGEYTHFSQGSLSPTGRPLDIAIEGPGYIGVITGQGVQYSRAGHLTLNSAGELVNPTGLRIADEGGQPIVIPEGTARITVSETGAVSADGNEVGALMIREFESPHLMNAMGNNLFTTDQTPITPEEGRVSIRQGFIEESNVNAIAATTDMMLVNRKYQNVQRMLQLESERMQLGIRRLSGRN